MAILNPLGFDSVTRQHLPAVPGDYLDPAFTHIPVTSGTGALASVVGAPTMYTDTVTGDKYYRDALGVIAVFPAAGGSSGLATANNGLTVNPAGNVKLGGALLANTAVDGDFKLSRTSGVAIAYEGTTTGAVPAFNANTSGGTAAGYKSTTSGSSSYGIHNITSGVGAHGTRNETTGLGAHGVYNTVAGVATYGVRSETSGTLGYGYYATTTGLNAVGTYNTTTNTGAHGTYNSTTGAAAHGTNNVTTGFSSHGIQCSTSGTSAHGVKASAVGLSSFAGHFTGDIFYTGALVPSDKRLKENITPVTTSVLPSILALSVQTFDKYDEFDLELPVATEEQELTESQLSIISNFEKAVGREFSEEERKAGVARVRQFRGNRTGVIAQELQQVFPQFVNTSGEFLAIDESGINYMLLKAVQELAAQVAALQGK